MSEQQRHESRGGLLALPVEIRLKILRHLLVQPAPSTHERSSIQWMDDATASSIPEGESIGKIMWYNNVSGGDDDERLTGQVLQTCRQIYHEGVDMLYRDNRFTFTLPVGRRLDARQSVLFMGGLEMRPLAAADEYPGLRQATKYRVAINVDPALKNQRIDAWHYRHVRTVVDELRELCPERRLHAVDVDLSYGDDRLYRDDQARHMTHSFGLLRAERVSLAGVPDDFARRLQRLITSSAPVVDLRRDYDHAIRDGRETRTWQTIGSVLRHRLLMLAAMLDWDVDRFERLKNARDLFAAVTDLAEYHSLVAVVDPPSRPIDHIHPS